jgi:hypothetical protein
MTASSDGVIKRQSTSRQAHLLKTAHQFQWKGRQQQEETIHERHPLRLDIALSVPLYDMRQHDSSSLQSVLQSSTNAEKVMMVMSVSTDRIKKVEDNLKYLEMDILFYPCKHDNINPAPKLDFKVIMPRDWTPKMYLAVLNNSVIKHLILSLESITIDGRIYATINELEWLFSAAD